MVIFPTKSFTSHYQGHRHMMKPIQCRSSVLPLVRLFSLWTCWQHLGYMQKRKKRGCWLDGKSGGWSTGTNTPLITNSYTESGFLSSGRKSVEWREECCLFSLGKEDEKVNTHIYAYIRTYIYLSVYLLQIRLHPPEGAVRSCLLASLMLRLPTNLPTTHPATTSQPHNMS